MPLSTITEVVRTISDAQREAIVPPSRSVSLPSLPAAVQSRRDWLEKRAGELAAALDDHLAFAQQVGERPDTRLLLDWTSELSAILAEMDRKGGK